MSKRAKNHQNVDSFFYRRAFQHDNVKCLKVNAEYLTSCKFRIKIYGVKAKPAKMLNFKLIFVGLTPVRSSLIRRNQQDWNKNEKNWIIKAPSLSVRYLFALFVKVWQSCCALTYRDEES